MDSTGWYCDRHHVCFAGEAEDEHGYLPCGCEAWLHVDRCSWAGSKNGKPHVYVRFEVLVDRGGIGAVLWPIFSEFDDDNEALAHAIRHRFSDAGARRDVLLDALEHCQGPGATREEWGFWGA